MMMMVVMTTLSGRQALCASSYLCTCCPPNTVFPRRTSSALARQDNILVFFFPQVFWALPFGVLVSYTVLRPVCRSPVALTVLGHGQEVSRVFFFLCLGLVVGLRLQPCKRWRVWCGAPVEACDAFFEGTYPTWCWGTPVLIPTGRACGFGLVTSPRGFFSSLAC